jgi:hypothetical protein
MAQGPWPSLKVPTAPYADYRSHRALGLSNFCHIRWQPYSPPRSENSDGGQSRRRGCQERVVLLTVIRVHKYKIS